MILHASQWLVFGLEFLAGGFVVAVLLLLCCGPERKESEQEWLDRQW